MRECITIVGIYIKHLCFPNVTNITSNHLIITVLLKLSSVPNLDKIAKNEHRFIGYDDLKINIKIVFKAKSQSFGGYFVTKILLNTKKKRADGLFHDSRSGLNQHYQSSIKPYHEIDFVSIRQFIFN